MENEPNPKTPWIQRILLGLAALILGVNIVVVVHAILASGLDSGSVNLSAVAFNFCFAAVVLSWWLFLKAPASQKQMIRRIIAVTAAFAAGILCLAVLWSVIPSSPPVRVTYLYVTNGEWGVFRLDDNSNGATGTNGSLYPKKPEPGVEPHIGEFGQVTFRGMHTNLLIIVPRIETAAFASNAQSASGVNGTWSTNGTLITSDAEASLPQIMWNSYNSDIFVTNADGVKFPTEAQLTNTAMFYKAIGLSPQYVKDFMLDSGWSYSTNTSGVLITTPSRFPDGIPFISNWLHTNLAGSRFWLLACPGVYWNTNRGVDGVTVEGIYGYEQNNATAFLQTYGIDGLSFNEDGAGAVPKPLNPENAGSRDIAIFRDTAINLNHPISIMWNHANTPLAQRYLVQGVSGDICEDGPGYGFPAVREWAWFCSTYDAPAGTGGISVQLPYVTPHWHPCFTTTGLFQGNTNMLKGFLCQMAVAPARFYISETTQVAQVEYLLTNNNWYYGVFHTMPLVGGKTLSVCPTNEVAYRPIGSGPYLGSTFVSFWNKDTNSISPTLIASLAQMGLNPSSNYRALDIFANTNCLVSDGVLSVGAITNGSGMGFILTPLPSFATLPGLLLPSQSSPPPFSLVGATNTVFIWCSNPPASTAPTNWFQYYDATFTLRTSYHLPP